MNNSPYYDIDILKSKTSDVSKVKDALSSVVTAIGDITNPEKMDVRMIDYYNETMQYFEKLTDFSTKIKNDINELTSFNTWLSTQNEEAEQTDFENQQAVENQQSGDTSGEVAENPVGEGDASQIESEDVNSGVGENPVGQTETPNDLQNGEISTGVAGVAAGVGGAATELVENAINTEGSEGEGEHKYLTPATTALEDYPITKEDLSDLSSDDSKTIEEKLRLVGYTDDEIRDFQEGNMKLPKVVVSDVATALEETLQSHPELRDKLKERYGFDLFYEDGTINPTKLASALVIDAKNSNDGYDLIKMLSNDYDKDLIGMGNMTQFANKINDAMELNPELRNQLAEKYGFDIFNPDGTVNEDKLRYALMIDGFDSIDDLDMVGTLYSSYGIDVNSLSSLDTLSMKLLDQLEQNPQLRQQLMDKFGFDIFNPDGSVNMDRLRYALMLDTFDKNDQLDFLNILYGNEAGNMPDGLLDNLSIQLLSGLELDPEMRGRLIDMYGFDILNEDGTINLERLKYALMIDGIDPEDDLDLSKYLGNYLGQFVNEVTNTEDTLTTRKKGNPIPIIAGIGLAAAAGGAGYTMYKKQKEEEEASDEDKLYEDEDADFEDEIDI